MFDAEKAHYRMMSLFKFVTYLPFGKFLIRKIYGFNSKGLETEFLGLNLKNPIGLAAGFDKDGRFIDLLGLLGFGFIEVGTVTPLPQDGNPKPRLFRLKEDRALINRMGFNNQGVDALVNRLKKVKNRSIIIGGNIGKNKITPNETAYKDYEVCFHKLYPYVDYFVINVSSPNTPGLRELQEKEPLNRLIKSLIEINYGKDKQKPILLKIAPDLNERQLDDIADIVINSGIDGLIISNTTIDRTNLKSDDQLVARIGAGGLSGKPVFKKSNAVLQYISEKTNGQIPIIGVGGIETYRDALIKMNHGAKLVQVYSGFIYEGPKMIKNICTGLLNHSTRT